jgi:hypothetical protein
VILTRFPINSSGSLPEETNATKSRTDANVSTKGTGCLLKFLTRVEKEREHFGNAEGVGAKM